MIGWLSGKIVDLPQPGKMVLDVNGVGYDVEMSLSSYFRLEGSKEKICVYIQTIVREDAILLYGFIDKQERALFRALIKVNGVGPKLAIAILSSITPEDFIRCIQQESAVLLTQIPGIGKKTAERLIVEMKDTLRQFTIDNQSTSVKVDHPYYQQNEAISALEALGYKITEATKVINQIDDGQKSAEQLIRQALQRLAKVSS
jgi:Holliday junction DNA helicase RuvA